MNRPNPLLAFFDGLRKDGLPLDIDSLALLLRALEGGFGVKSTNAFEQLCRTLWVKTEEDDLLLRRHLALLEQEFMHHLGLLEQEIKKLQADLSRRIEARSKPKSSAIPSSISPADIFPNALDTPTIDDVIPELPHTSSKQQIEQQTRNDSFDASATDRRALEDLIYRAVHAPEEVEALLSMEVPFNRNDYLPVSRRQMKQIWRYLRRMVREGRATELDIEASIAHYGRSGFGFEPVFVPRRINRAKLLLCIDHGGSMVPFGGISQRLAETAMAGGRLSAADIYYFRNWPDEWLFHDTGHLNATPLNEVLVRIDPKATNVVIFSDAGAARGGFSRERIEATRHFLGHVWQRTTHVCWLNPLPGHRWDGTSADHIARLSPMVEVSRRGMEEMIRILRGNRPRSLIVSPFLSGPP